MFDAVLVANRGEIAVRIIRTLRRLGIRAVAVHSDADAGARHVLEADQAVRIGPAAPAQSYLRYDRIVEAAIASGAAAIHPGYGFLSENPALARACGDAGIAFVGPPASAIEAMGDKITAKRTVEAAGVPVVPGRDGTGMDDGALADAAVAIGMPVLLKPSAGGGGKGMRLVRDAGDLAEAIAGARREAAAAFGDDTLLIERYVERPRHIEVQVIADAHGTVLHLGERECSLQRRHQKIVEEAPSALLTPAQRAAMGASAVAAARSCGYVNAGTVEFIVGADRPDEFFFIEMNTRLQVEHPVTELVTGLDLVELQLRVASGEALPLTQDEVVLRGHAVEARVYAEDPDRGFLPTGGRVLAVRHPEGPNVRVDSALQPGLVVGSDYDPMLAKVVGWGRDRAGALGALDGALAATTVLGVTTNVPFLRRLLRHPDVVAGDLDTDLVGRAVDELTGADVPDHAVAAAALVRLAERQPAPGTSDPWALPDGWRIGERAWSTYRASVGGDVVEVHVRGAVEEAEIEIGDSPPLSASVALTGDLATVAVARETRAYRWARDGDVLWLATSSGAWSFAEHDLLESEAQLRGPGGAGPLRSPMPGTVVSVSVQPGDAVDEAQPLVVVEAMKMEHTIRAAAAGVVGAVRVAPGDRVGADQVLVEMLPPTDE